MSVDNLNDQFANWNPMENDYKSVDFNKYNTGPGAGIDSALQPGQLALQKAAGNSKVKHDGPTPFLVFKNMPENMTMSAIRNICSRHGQVTAVRDSKKNDFYFVDLASVADMEAVYRALENNNYGFKVLVGKHFEKNLDMERNRRDQDVPPVPPRSVGIDYQNRTYRTSSIQHPRPKLQETMSLLNDNNNSNLPLNLLASDVHSLEREGIYNVNTSDKFNYKNGRSFIKMPEKTKEFVKNKNSESSGRYSPTKDSFATSMDENKKLTKLNKCSQCERYCDTVCSRCSLYYCSVKCQKDDWQQHRYICGKPKHLQRTPPPKVSKKSETTNEQHKFGEPSTPSNHQGHNAPKITQNSPNTEENQYKQQMPRSGNVVTITAISKTNLVFIRSKTYEDNMSYFKTKDSLQAIGKKLKPLKTLPKCGNVVIAEFEQQFNRALVLNTNNPNSIVVNYMDYGSLDRLKLEDLYEAPQEFLQTPRHAIPVVLKNVPDCYMTDEIRTFMYTYLNNISVYIKYTTDDYIDDNNVFAVELIDEATQQNLNNIIIKLAKPTEPLSVEEICNREYLKQKSLPSGENVEFIVMDNSLMLTGCISCTTKPFALEIQKFQKELQSYVESLPKTGYAPRAEELCIARYSEDGMWYRGRCLEVVGDGHPTILFIDYGNIAMIKIADIRRYPRQFTYPLYTADCEIQGLPESCNEQIVAKLEELIPNGSTIKCQKVKAFEDDHFYSISLPNVIHELTSCGLI